MITATICKAHLGLSSKGVRELWTTLDMTSLMYGLQWGDFCNNMLGCERIKTVYENWQLEIPFYIDILDTGRKFRNHERQL